MTTTDLVKEIAVRTGLTQADASKAIKSAVEIVVEELAKGESVRIVDFGTFNAKEKAERKGHNPRTGEEITIPAHKKVSFSEAKTLREAVNQ